MLSGALKGPKTRYAAISDRMLVVVNGFRSRNFCEEVHDALVAGGHPLWRLPAQLSTVIARKGTLQTH
jgi:hypothetical protein